MAVLLSVLRSPQTSTFVPDAALGGEVVRSRLS
jgi:hypothetical protein